MPKMQLRRIELAMDSRPINIYIFFRIFIFRIFNIHVSDMLACVFVRISVSMLTCIFTENMGEIVDIGRRMLDSEKRFFADAINFISPLLKKIY